MTPGCNKLCHSEEKTKKEVPGVLAGGSLLNKRHSADPLSDPGSASPVAMPTGLSQEVRSPQKEAELLAGRELQFEVFAAQGCGGEYTTQLWTHIVGRPPRLPSAQNQAPCPLGLPWPTAQKLLSLLAFLGGRGGVGGSPKELGNSFNEKYSPKVPKCCGL